MFRSWSLVACTAFWTWCSQGIHHRARVSFRGRWDKNHAVEDTCRELRSFHSQYRQFAAWAISLPCISQSRNLVRVQVGNTFHHGIHSEVRRLDLAQLSVPWMTLCYPCVSRSSIHKSISLVWKVPHWHEESGTKFPWNDVDQMLHEGEGLRHIPRSELQLLCYILTQMRRPSFVYRSMKYIIINQ